MKKNILKKFVFLFSVIFVLFGYNFVFASDDIISPIITLGGATPIDLTVGDHYIDLGATAIDDIDGLIAVTTSDLTLVDTTKAGIYIVTYTATDMAGNTATSTRTVNVKESISTTDVTAPIITLNGMTPIDLIIGASYVDLGATATDDVDGSIAVETSDLTLVDATKAGIYTITYTATDTSGNVATKTRTINIKDLPTVLKPIDIHLEIISGKNSLFDNSISVAACDSDNDKTTPDTITAYCAIKQLEKLDTPILSDWSWYDWGVLLNSINNIVGITTKDKDNNNVYHYWSWSLNGVYGETGLNQYELKSDDKILLEFIDPQPEIVVDDTPSVNVHLKVYSGDSILFNNGISIHACAESLETDAPITMNGKCAIEKSKLSNTWTWYDSNFKKDSSLPKTLGVLDELGGSSSDDKNYFYWGWFGDLNYGSIALNKHIVSEGEELLLTYNSHPLSISASTISGKIGETIIFTVKEKSTFNGDWSDMVWTPLVDATVTLGTQSCITISEGTCSIVLNTAGSLKAIGSKSLYVPNNINIEVSENTTTASNSGGSNTLPVEKIFSTPSALSFLSQNQKSDGSYGSTMYTDWVAIASAAGNNITLKSSILNYLKSNPISSSTITDYERRAMALMALGVNPYTGTDVNYINKIIASYDGIQIGDSSLSNDDIFGLIVLLNSGYTKNDEIIKNVVSFIIKNKSSNGSWGSVDMTAAAIESLNGIKSLSGVGEAISKGESYLVSEQKNDGSFGNISSTSWVIQALSLNNSNVTQIDKAIKYLAMNQYSDGGLNEQDTIDNRIWATSYAVPAVLKLSWSNILESFSKEENIKTDLPIQIDENISNPLENKDIVKPELINNEKVVVVEVKEIKEAPMKVAQLKKEKIIKKINKKLLTSENSSDNLLLASVGNSEKNVSTFFSIINTIIQKIEAPFAWLWYRLGF